MRIQMPMYSMIQYPCQSTSQNFTYDDQRHKHNSFHKKKCLRSGLEKWSNWIQMSDPFTEERVNSSVGLA